MKATITFLLHAHVSVELEDKFAEYPFMDIQEHVRRGVLEKHIAKVLDPADKITINAVGVTEFHIESFTKPRRA